jgi:hypothetical protein
MRARKEHGSPLRKRNRPEVAYAMRIAVLLGKPSRSQRNPREDQRVLLSFPRSRDSQKCRMSMNFRSPRYLRDIDLCLII